MPADKTPITIPCVLSHDLLAWFVFCDAGDLVCGARHGLPVVLLERPKLVIMPGSGAYYFESYAAKAIFPDGDIGTFYGHKGMYKVE